MSTTSSLKTQPRVPGRHPRAHVGRLDSLFNPQPRPLPRIPRPAPKDCPNPECKSAESIEEDGKMICGNCGTVIQEMNMVSDINFGITAGGQHVLHGVRVGENETRHRSGDMPNANRGQSSEEISKQHGMYPT